MRREEENRSVNIIFSYDAEKLLQTNSILTTILLKPDDILVGYDRASMTRMISTSVRIGSLNLVNDDVVEEIKTY